MTRALALQTGIGALLATTGLILLARPALGGRILRLADSREASYAVRIAGLMLAMLGLMIAGFTLVFAWFAA